MQYTYTVLEAAALWLGLEPANIEAKMKENDFSEAESLMRQKLLTCEGCLDQFGCPEWRGNCPEDLELICPENFERPPSKEVSDYLPRRSSPYLPNTSEFPEYPGLRQRVELLMAALECGDLDGSPAAITHPNLRSWIAAYDPSQKPSFLYDSEESLTTSDPKVLAVIGALLAELNAKRVKQTAVRDNIAEKLGMHRGFGTRKLDDLFSLANIEYRKLLPDK